MLPVWGNPLIGTGVALNLTVGTARATPAAASDVNRNPARTMDTRRICSLLHGQVRLDPGSPGALGSGDIESPTFGAYISSNPWHGPTARLKRHMRPLPPCHG